MYKENQKYILEENNEQLANYRQKPAAAQHTNLKELIHFLEKKLEWYYDNRHDKIFVKGAPKAVNPDFAEYIFKFGCNLATGYFSSGVKDDLYTKEGNKYIRVMEHWVPRTALVGKVIYYGLYKGEDRFGALNGDCSYDNILKWLIKWTPLFCSHIITTKAENQKLNSLTKLPKKKNGLEPPPKYTFEQILNLEHYKEAGITLHRNLCLFNKYNKTDNKENWSFIPDHSYHFPEIDTPAMKELWKK